MNESEYLKSGFRKLTRSPFWRPKKRIETIPKKQAPPAEKKTHFPGYATRRRIQGLESRLQEQRRIGQHTLNDLKVSASRLEKLERELRALSEFPSKDHRHKTAVEIKQALVEQQREDVVFLNKNLNAVQQAVAKLEQQKSELFRSFGQESPNA